MNINNNNAALKNYYLNQQIIFLREIELNLLSYLILKNEDTDRILEINNSNENSSIASVCKVRGKNAITLTTPTSNKELNNIIQETILYKDDSLDNEKIVVISEENNPFIEQYFKSCLEEGISCLYAISGQLGKDIMYKDNEIKKSVSKIADSNYKSTFAYDKVTNTFAKIYIMKKIKNY